LGKTGLPGQQLPDLSSGKWDIALGTTAEREAIDEMRGTLAGRHFNDQEAAFAISPAWDAFGVFHSERLVKSLSNSWRPAFISRAPY